MITRRKLLKLTLASLVTPAIPSSRARGAFLHSPARAELLEAARPCPTLVLDTALARISHPWTQAESLLPAVSALRPQALSYPGHHLADYWDWQTGWVDTPRLQQCPYTLPRQIIELMRSSGVIDLEELKTAAAATGAPVLFSANLFTRSPRLTGSGDAGAGKTFLLDGLRACAARGMPAHWLLLGDSLAGEQAWSWSPASAVFRGDPASGQTDYPSTAVDWAAAARQQDSGLTVAAFATGPLTVNDLCSTQWNTRLVQYLAAQNSIQALAFSLNIDGSLGISAISPGRPEQQQQYALLKDAQALRALFNQPPAALQAWLNQPIGAGQPIRGSGLRFWLNACHLVDPIGALRYTWAHGLLLAQALQAVLREPLIDLAVLHNTADYDNAAFHTRLDLFRQLALLPEDGLDRLALENSLHPGERTALGHIFGLFFEASRAAASVQPLALDPLNDPLVWGWAFTQDPARPHSLLLGNLTEAEVAVDLSAVWAAAGGVMAGRIYHAAPWEFITGTSSQPGVPFALQIRAADTQPASPLRLPPYSLALLSGLKRENLQHLAVIQK